MNADVEKLYALTDLVILDIKHIDSAEHVKLVGFPNKNPLAMAAYREKTGKPMWLRYVLVPGYNDSEEVVRRWCEAFAAYRTVERVELLPYHTLGVSKYAELGRRYPLEGVEPPSSASIAQARKILEEFFDQVSVH